MDKANTTNPALTVSKVLGTIGLPTSSFRAVMFAAQRMVAMLMKTELFAMCRPRQILCFKSVKGESTEALVLYIPRSKALRQKVPGQGEQIKIKKEFPMTYKGYMSCGWNSIVKYSKSYWVLRNDHLLKAERKWIKKWMNFKPSNRHTILCIY